MILIILNVRLLLIYKFNFKDMKIVALCINIILGVQKSSEL